MTSKVTDSLVRKTEETKKEGKELREKVVILTERLNQMLVIVKQITEQDKPGEVAKANTMSTVSLMAS